MLGFQEAEPSPGEPLGRSWGRSNWLDPVNSASMEKRLSVLMLWCIAFSLPVLPFPLPPPVLSLRQGEAASQIPDVGLLALSQAHSVALAVNYSSPPGLPEARCHVLSH